MLETVLVKVDLTFYTCIALLVVALYFIKQVNQSVTSVKILKNLTISSLSALSLYSLTFILSEFDCKIGEITYSILFTVVVILNIVNLILVNLYLKYELDEGSKIKKGAILLLVGTLVVACICMIVGLFMGQFITYTYEKGFKTGIFYEIVSVLKAVYLLYGVYLYVTFINKMDKTQHIFFGGVAIVEIVSLCVSLFLFDGLYYYNLVILPFFIIIAYVSIASKYINKDATTQVSSFNSLEDFLFKLEKKNKKDYAIAAIYIDSFDNILKNYGITEAEKILYKTAKCIKKELKGENFISSYRSDKFFIYLDTSDKKAIEEIMLVLETNLRNENFNSSKAYSISFTYVYEIWNEASHKSYIDLLEEVEYKLYTKKELN